MKAVHLLNHLIQCGVKMTVSFSLKKHNLGQSLFPSVGHIIGLTLFPVERSATGFFNSVFL